jgi:hypothetical protein
MSLKGAGRSDRLDSAASYPYNTRMAGRRTRWITFEGGPFHGERRVRCVATSRRFMVQGENVGTRRVEQHEYELVDAAADRARWVRYVRTFEGWSANPFN